VSWWLSASVQCAVPAASSTEAFAWTFAVITAAMAAGSAIGGVVIQGTSPETAFLAAGELGLAGVAFGTLWEGFTERSPTRRRPLRSGSSNALNSHHERSRGAASATAA
jgi:predicted MFS family arabinose efflux permease